MSKQKIIYYTLLVLFACVCVWAIHILRQEHEEKLVWLAFLTPILFAAVIISVSRNIFPKKKLRQIEKLANEISILTDKKMEMLDENDAPHEILPLVKAINKLISYQEDKYNQERDFTANASHELRTPLAGISLQAELAMKTKDEKVREKALINITKAIERAIRMVEQLLIISRLTAEKIELNLQQLDLAIIIKIVIGELSPVAQEKNISVRFNDKEEPFFIMGNEQSISILVNNLIKNAIIYIPSGGEVKINIDEIEKDKISLEISDNGPGIQEDKRKKVLERFEKADSGSKTGTGLGLSIVKRIADLHKASLELLGNEPSTGLKVRLVFSKF